MTGQTGSADHRHIFAKAAAWRGQPMALATVIETWRSAPCPVGTHMLVNADGDFIGSVSGGCVEGDVLETAAAVIAGEPSVVRRYGVADGVAWDVGLPCGGTIAVLVQPVSDAGFPPDLIDHVMRATASGEAVRIGTDTQTGLSVVESGDETDIFTNVYKPPRRLLIVGAVEIAIALAAIATRLGVAVTVIDPRSRFLTEARFPDVAHDDRWPDEAIAALNPDSQTAIVTLSHDTKIDDPALRAAIASDAGYIAALGSRTSHAARCDRLRVAGAHDDQIARIEGPAGIAINATSAPEIALSIAAGMIRVFNEGSR